MQQSVPLAAAAQGQRELLAIGNVVDVRKHGRATIVAGPWHEPGHERHGRYQVQYDEDGTTFWVTPQRIRPMALARKRVVVAYKTAEYRQAAVHNVGRRDVVLEIGCHEGRTTHMLSKRCAAVIGVDLTPQVVHLARQRYPSVRFEVLDGADVEGALRLASEAGHPAAFSKVLVDISGQAPLVALLPVLDRWMRATPRDTTLIVKNRALHCLLSVAQQQQQQQQQPPHPEVHQAAAATQEGRPSAQDHGNALSQVVTLLLQLDAAPGPGGGEGPGAEQQAQLREVLDRVLEQGEVFVDPATAHRKAAVAVRAPDRAREALARLQANPALAAAAGDLSSLQRLLSGVGSDSSGGEEDSGSEAGEGVQRGRGPAPVAAVLPSGVAAVLEAAKVAESVRGKEATRLARMARRAEARERREQQQEGGPVPQVEGRRV